MPVAKKEQRDQFFRFQQCQGFHRGNWVDVVSQEETVQLAVKSDLGEVIAMEVVLSSEHIYQSLHQFIHILLVPVHQVVKLHNLEPQFGTRKRVLYVADVLMHAAVDQTVSRELGLSEVLVTFDLADGLFHSTSRVVLKKTLPNLLN